MSGGGSPGNAAEFQRRVEEYNRRQVELNAGRPTVSALPSFRENARYPARIVGAFLLGLVAVLISRYVRYHMNGGALGGEGADVSMILDGTMAAATGFALRQAFKFEAKVFLSAFNVGVTAMILLMHNLVHVAPEAFGVAFSDEWVQVVIEQTEPNSILFMGDSIPIGGTEEKASASPRILRVGQD